MLRHRWAVLGVVAALSALAVLAIVERLELDTSVEAFTANDSPAQQVLEEFRDTFGRDELILVLVEGEVFTLPFLEELRALHNELAALDIPIPSLGARGAEREVKRHHEGIAAKLAHPEGEVAPDEEVLPE